MKPIDISKIYVPEAFRSLIERGTVYDSSSSPDAKVYYIDADDGYYLKTSGLDALTNEKLMLDFLSLRHMSPKVLNYYQDRQDWLLTAKANGNNCISLEYLENPIRLVDTVAEALHMLHSLDLSECPVKNRTADYINSYLANKNAGLFNPDHLFFFDRSFRSPTEASGFIDGRIHILKNDTIVHGDYCLPNIILKDWKFSSFIDVGFAGAGDKNIDVFWAVWSLRFNFKTDKYTKMFIDAYGRDSVDMERLQLISAIECFA